MSSAPWIRDQLQTLLAQRGHAWLLHGPSGLGQYDLAQALASSWLCDLPTAQGGCGNCQSCHQISVHAHTDLCVLMPETVLIASGWPLGEKAQADIDDKKRKPSREIRVDAMRDAIEFSQRTSGRGRGKAVLVYPAERMNTVTANALLKTLEEPPGDVRFVLASEAAHQLLPTIRSRCLSHAMTWPAPAPALAWLGEQGLTEPQAQALLRAAGGRPEGARQLAEAGVDAKAWAALAQAWRRGETGAAGGWPAAQVIEAMQKVCHDLMALRAGAAPRFFAAAELPPPPSMEALRQWSRTLMQSARTAEHPFNPGLFLEALVSQARSALNSKL